MIKSTYAKLSKIVVTIILSLVAVQAIALIIPPPATGSLYILNAADDNVLRRTPEGIISIYVTNLDILAATGNDTAQLRETGLAFNSSGDLFFVDSAAERVLKKPRNGSLTALTSAGAFDTAAGAFALRVEGLAFGSDGMLYVTDDSECSCVFRVDPDTGAVDVFVSKATVDSLDGITDFTPDHGIIGTPDGKIYVASDGDPGAVIEVDLETGTPSVLVSGEPLATLDAHMTRMLNGDLLVGTRNGAEGKAVIRVTTGGATSVFLSTAQLDAASPDADVNTEDGLVFDALGNFYLIPKPETGINMWPVLDLAAGTIDTANSTFIQILDSGSLSSALAFEPGIFRDGFEGTD